MGLDNGIVIKGKTLKAQRFLAENFKHLEDRHSLGDFEFGYWRKCWNIREAFLDNFSKNGYDGQGGHLNLSIKDLERAYDVTLRQFLDEKNWDYNGHYSFIFSWIQELPHIAETMYNINKFLELFEENEDEYGNELELSENDFEIYFYDSF